MAKLLDAVDAMRSEMDDLRAAMASSSDNGVSNKAKLERRAVELRGKTTRDDDSFFCVSNGRLSGDGPTKDAPQRVSSRTASESSVLAAIPELEGSAPAGAPNTASSSLVSFLPNALFA